MDAICTLKCRLISDGIGVELYHWVVTENVGNDVEISGLCAPRLEIFPLPVCKTATLHFRYR